MKELSDYTDQELDIERNRRYSLKQEKVRLAQDACEHEIIAHLHVSDEQDEHSGRHAVTFELNKLCKKCYKDIEDLRMSTYSAENEMEFKTGLEALCRKYGKVYSR